MTSSGLQGNGQDRQHGAQSTTSLAPEKLGSAPGTWWKILLCLQWDGELCCGQQPGGRRRLADTHVDWGQTPAAPHCSKLHLPSTSGAAVTFPRISGVLTKLMVFSIGGLSPVWVLPVEKTVGPRCVPRLPGPVILCRKAVTLAALT